MDSIDSTDVFLVRGGSPLRGTVRLRGAKNSALKLMAASLLTSEPLELHAVPDIADVHVMSDVLAGLNVTVTSNLADGKAVVHAASPCWHAPRDAVSRIRASIACLGPLVARLGRAQIALPGGDQIGARSIDLHLRGLERMGATVDLVNGEVSVTASRLHGATITLDFPSVGATENLVMAATCATGTTVIDNAAREPEIQDLCRMLEAMGAVVAGIGTSTLTIHGVDELHGVSWTTCPDRIEAGTYAIAAAATGGEVTIETVEPGHLTLPLIKLRDAGVDVSEDGDALLVRSGHLRPVDVVTLPYPGFPTDLQPQLMVLLTQAQGTSRCTENVFESRFSFVSQLQAMGAQIHIDGHHALIRGPVTLNGGTTMRSLDVRAGAAATLAGLIATGETIVSDVHHIDRGYADFVPRLRALGADIERIGADAIDG